MLRGEEGQWQEDQLSLQTASSSPCSVCNICLGQLVQGTNKALYKALHSGFRKHSEHNDTSNGLFQQNNVWAYVAAKYSLIQITVTWALLELKWSFKKNPY